MPPERIVKELLTLPTLEQKKQFLRSQASILCQDRSFADQVAQELKAQADYFLRTESEKSLELGELLIELADLTEQILYRALGLRAKGNVNAISQGEHKEAIERYDEAAAIYEAAGYQLEQAKSQVGKIWSLAMLGDYEKALESGKWVSDIFELHEQWFWLGQVKENLASIYGWRLRDDYKALQLIHEAQDIYKQLSEAGQKHILSAELNRSNVLRHLGHFEMAIESSQQAYTQLVELGHTIEAARAQLNLAKVYLVLGRYNEANMIFNHVRDIYLADKRWFDAISLKLRNSDYLLRLGRFTEVLYNSREISELSRAHSLHLEAGQAILNEAEAYVGLHQYREALDSLSNARHLFELAKNEVFIAKAELQRAVILHRQGEFELSFEIALRSVSFFREKGLLMQEARSKLLAAEAMLALARFDLARKLATEVLQLGQQKEVAWLCYQAYFLLGRLAERQNEELYALDHYQKAIEELEWLQGRVMVEYRADYLADKGSIYEHIVRLCLRLKKYEEALTYAEQAKSRTLRDLLDGRVNLKIHPKDEKDKSLIQELEALQHKRNQIVIRWEGEEVPAEQLRQEVLEFEKEITRKWHELLIRNASYAREAELWYIYQERTIPPIQKALDAESVLLEYFIAGQDIILFIVSKKSIQAHYLPTTIGEVNSLLQKFTLTLNLVPRTNNNRLPKLAAKTAHQLCQLYDLLIAPIEEVLVDYRAMIIVPHGVLHYLPFHILCDGKESGEQGLALLQKYNITYLPNASLLPHYNKTNSTRSDVVTFGYSNNEQLPYTINEANTISKIMGGQVFIEQEASLANLRRVASNCRILHLSTHGDFRPDNPIFSALMLHDGPLTTLDAFNLDLNASLVTLSACQTGRHLIGGGDELLGLTRAFLYAGAASLVLSFWRVYDHSTTLLMQRFYQKLADGYSKSEALRQAQCDFINLAGQPSSGISARYKHPYYWAAFFLVGHAGSL